MLRKINLFPIILHRDTTFFNRFINKTLNLWLKGVKNIKKKIIFILISAMVCRKIWKHSSLLPLSFGFLRWQYNNRVGSIKTIKQQLIYKYGYLVRDFSLNIYRLWTKVFARWRQPFRLSKTLAGNETFFCNILIAHIEMCIKQLNEENKA